MITEAILGLFLDLGGLLADLLPDGDVAGLQGFGQAIAAFKAFDVGLPVSETLTLAASALVITGALFLGRVGLMIWHAIPGKFS